MPTCPAGSSKRYAATRVSSPAPNPRDQSRPGSQFASNSSLVGRRSARYGNAMGRR
ncbi:hypothetical protein O7623_27585 [Solwaraspora sp. WMMD791]|uniref:hypothetical protein n=1 Tax=Solwaraspora sp. WMMD791 TaxID=3016086 RepID=UPI00249B69D8|nr:hypothetical protein [Solwaraspora sp. WMMD791]WFE30877.1 hypothetical protein O7623_27585 [Solwaraspora sp. WMMD791]